jgi:hypothetical protein
MLNSDVYWITCEMDVTCDLLCWITMILACMLVGLKSLVISLDYQSYMGSSVRIWSLWRLFLYLCSYNLDGSVTRQTLMKVVTAVARRWAQETWAQMTKRTSLWGVGGKKQGKPLYLREGSERQITHLDSRAIPSRQNRHIVLPSCVRATD